MSCFAHCDVDFVVVLVLPTGVHACDHFVCNLHHLSRSANAWSVPDTFAPHVTNSKFRRGAQQDAHEYLVHLRALMHKQCKAVEELFQGNLSSKLVCTTCNGVSTRLDPFFDLQVPVGSRTLQHALDNYAAPVYASDVNCGACKSKTKCVKTIQPSSFGPIVVFQIKRFQFTQSGSSKTHQRVEFDENMSLGGKAYQAYAVVRHHGNHLAGGHYTCTVRSPDGKWRHLDNSSSDPKNEIVPLDRALDPRNVYMVMYRAVSDAAASIRIAVSGATVPGAPAASSAAAPARAMASTSSAASAPSRVHDPLPPAAPASATSSASSGSWFGRLGKIASSVASVLSNLMPHGSAPPSVHYDMPDYDVPDMDPSDISGGDVSESDDDLAAGSGASGGDSLDTEALDAWTTDRLASFAEDPCDDQITFTDDDDNVAPQRCPVLSKQQNQDADECVKMLKAAKASQSPSKFKDGELHGPCGSIHGVQFIPRRSMPMPCVDTQGFVWVPELQFGADVAPVKCPRCHQGTVQSHGYGRRRVLIKEYATWLVFRRYKCTKCKVPSSVKSSDHAKRIKMAETALTFNSTDANVRALLPQWVSLQFPFVCTQAAHNSIMVHESIIQDCLQALGRNCVWDAIRKSIEEAHSHTWGQQCETFMAYQVWRQRNGAVQAGSGGNFTSVQPVEFERYSHSAASWVPNADAIQHVVMQALRHQDAVFTKLMQGVSGESLSMVR